MQVFFVLALALTTVAGTYRDVLMKNGDDEALQTVLRGLEALESSNNNYTVEYLITENGYPVETHHVTTSDGYFLTLHRIPYGRTGKTNGKVAFLQHGLLSSASDWCILGAGKALAFQLADEGYDVWLGNARGNTWSCHHVNFTTKDAAFWKFSFHEIATMDLPAMIDYVLEQTAVKGIYYVGHSQGSTVFYVMTSMLPEYNSKIFSSVSLAPIGFMNHMTSPLLQILSQWSDTWDYLLNMIGVNEFFPNDDFMKYVVGDALCNQDSITQLLCTNALFAICGFNRDQMNTSLLPILFKYTPAGSSTRQFLHYAQEIKSGYFRRYDYGTISNMVFYGNLTPPSYDLSKITVPTYLLYSKNDWLSAETDVNRLCSGMTSGCKGKIVIGDFQFNHLDYLFGIDAPKFAYDKVISLFARH